MIVDLPATSTAQVNRKMVEMRESGGAVALGRVLTFVVVTDDSTDTEEVIESANAASRQHPCRVIMLVRGARKAAARLDAQIRVGGDAGASEVIVLRGYGPLASAEAGAGMTIPLLLPDTPVVIWWPGPAPAKPAEDPVGRLASRRITDAAAEKSPLRALEHRAANYVPGDTDLAWTRLTLWRAQLTAALDQPPYDDITSAVVDGEPESPSTDLLAGWLASRLAVPVKRTKVGSGGGMHSARLNRASGAIELTRPDGKIGSLTQPGQPSRRITLHRRPVRDCLAEEMRRLDADETYAEALRALPNITRGRAPAGRGK
ncbi:glucose-6-phosphate dehydrogenase assembly protein OpcA [Pseudonocardia spinosispora]|uniref:glucose-6-phosphate dehydrogenase assembly protein OpcA n=1 Tax=Pseudonocardia spinosispora TaxID=103441 RepID=UPI000429F284|nr:glucose-6-phosphate dehydrogenase assembly protein OpcA [Pseudonocardia spinosispora]